MMLDQVKKINDATRCWRVSRMVMVLLQDTQVKFRTPNVVVVFSNAEPDVMQLSNDRWKILRIKKDGLDSKQKQLSKIVNM